jgi:O-antigen ligase
MVLLAAKGPLLFLLTTMTIKYWKVISITSVKLWKSLLLGLAISYLFAVITGIGVFDTLMNRLTFFSGGLEADDSSLVRLILISKGIELILENMIFGVGIGAYSLAIGEPDGRLSPHNLFIEVWAETGIISIVLLVTLCVLFLMKYRYLLKRYDFFLGKSIIYLCLFLFLGNMVSSYLEDLRVTYFWLGVSIAYYTMKIKSNQNRPETCAELVE